VIKAVAARRDGGSTVFLGLSLENTKRLHKDMPIKVNLYELDPRLPNIDIVIFGGDDEDEMTRKLMREVNR
jgi:hypothetical protein